MWLVYHWRYTGYLMCGDLMVIHYHKHYHAYLFQHADHRQPRGSASHGVKAERVFKRED